MKHKGTETLCKKKTSPSSPSSHPPHPPHPPILLILPILPITHSPFPITNYQLPITNYPLPIMKIDKEQVHKVAHLARLELTPEEEEKFTTQLSSILDYFEQLSELDTSQVKPTTRAIDVSNITRSDKLEPFANLEGIFACAPEQDGEFFRVPKIL